MSCDFIQAKYLISQRKRLSIEQCFDVFQNLSCSQLSILAQIAKANHHHPMSATYLIMAIINYTNICIAKCSYCAFYRLPHHSDTYLLTYNQICEKIDILKKYDGTLVAFNGGFNPKLKLSSYAELFSKIHNKYPDLCFFEMTVAEFMFACKISKLTYDQGAKILKQHGTQWITGGGAEVLSNSFRTRHSPGKYSVEDYYQAQRAIVEQGIGSTATMVIGFDETLEERFEHLDSLRKFQDSLDNKLKSFLCWSYKPYNTALKGREISHENYLRWINICRIYLDNFTHIRSSVLTQNNHGIDALINGADDFDLPIEDEVTQKAGATITDDFEQILHHGRKLNIDIKHRKPWSK